MAATNETHRLHALEDFDILYTAPEAAFDRLVDLAADLFDAPMAAISLIDAERQWFKARKGIDDAETPRDIAFCAHAIELDPNATMVVEDATSDARFEANPFVTGDANVRFYAGAVLTDSDGFNLGTLCVIDTKARPAPTEDELRRLKTLSRIVVDELELRRSRRIAAEKQQLLAMAERMSGIGHWRYQLGSGRITWSDEVYRIYGVSPRTFTPDFETAVAFYPEADREKVGEMVARAIETGEGYEFELRIRRGDGQLRDVTCKAECVFDDQGAVTALFGVFQDVTEQRAAAAALAQSEHRFRTLAVNAPDIICESRLDGVITYVSPACLTLTGYTQDELVGRTSFSWMHPDDGAVVAEMCRKVFAAKGALEPWTVEYRATRKDGREIWMESKPTLVTDPATGRFTGTADVIRDITARKTLEADLRLARAEAEAATAVKSDFLANMSHELRTPLTSIIGFSRLAAEQPDLGRLGREYVARVGDASAALLCTVNDILDFSRLEAGQVDLKPQPTSIARLGRATLDLFTPQAGAKDLTLSARDVAGDLVLAVDPDRIRQVMLNLVGNAVKFTAAGGVTVLTDYDPRCGLLRVEVADTGPGLTPEAQAKLFKRFSQVDGSLTRSHGGSGLGLAICKGLIEAMDGRIGVDSTPGVGSTFWFEVPAPVVKAVVEDHPQVARRAATEGLRILVADDHPANRELVRLYLTGVGAEVSEASDGAQAVEMALTQPYDLILMDMRMPRLDGPGALARIRAVAGPNDATPILAFTADGEPEAGPRAFELGFQGLVTKPVGAEALIDAVASACVHADTQAMELSHVA